jgi:cell division protein FtsB
MEQGTKNMVTSLEKIMVMVTSFGNAQRKFLVLSALLVLSFWVSIALMQDVRRIESMVLKTQTENEAIRHNVNDMSGIIRELESDLDSMRTLIGDAEK